MTACSHEKAPGAQAGSKVWAKFCSGWLSLGARMGLEEPNGGTAPWNAGDYPEHRPRVSEHRDFTHVGLTGTFSHTALHEELMDFSFKALKSKG